MKSKTEKSLKVSSMSDRKISAHPISKDRIDETYHQVNKVSFQQNFKALIGHYKTKETSITI
jgi:hypothetical protein